jgi:hypothetical protein
VHANIEAPECLAKTAPTTLAGLVEYVDYLRDRSSYKLVFDGDEEIPAFLELLHRHGTRS